MHLVRVAAALAVLAGFAASSIAEADSKILYRYDGVMLRDSKWGPIQEFQAALNVYLRGCHQEPVKADGLFGKGTREGLRNLASCEGWGDVQIGQGEPLDGVVTADLWDALTNSSEKPSSHQRELVLWLTHEATDYDVAEWNFKADGSPQPNDPDSLLTWGPYGATVGHGGEVQAILGKVPELTASCFGGDADTVSGLSKLSPSERASLVKGVFLDTDRRQRWKAGFKCFGSDARGRKAYDDYAFSSAWLKPALTRLIGLVPSDQLTEVDQAFFGDLAMHMSITADRVAKAKAAIGAATDAKGSALTPAERRRAIGNALVPSNQQLDRKGRNVVYYIDGVGEGALTEEERTAWRNRSKLKASMVGLSD